MAEIVLCPWPSVSSILLCAVTAGTEAECTRFRWFCYWQQTEWYQPSFLPLHSRVHKDHSQFSGVVAFYSYFLALHTSERSKKWWLPMPHQASPTCSCIADDVKLQPNEKVLCLDKVQMWCAKKRGRNIKSQSVTAVIQRPESDFCCSSRK